MSFLSPKLEARGFGARLGLKNSSQKLFLQVAIRIALPDGACGMDEVSNGGFDDVMLAIIKKWVVELNAPFMNYQRSSNFLLQKLGG